MYVTVWACGSERRESPGGEGQLTPLSAAAPAILLCLHSEFFFVVYSPFFCLWPLVLTFLNVIIPLKLRCFQLQGRETPIY